MAKGKTNTEMVEAHVLSQADREAIGEVFDKYLEHLPYVLWGDWDTTIKDRREKATEWWLEHLQGFILFWAEHPELGEPVL